MLGRLAMLYQQGQDSYDIWVRSVRLGQLYDLDQVCYDSQVVLVRFGQVSKERLVSLCQASQVGQVNQVRLDR